MRTPSAHDSLNPRILRHVPLATAYSYSTRACATVATCIRPSMATADGGEHGKNPSVMYWSIALRIETQVDFHLLTLT